MADLAPSAVADDLEKPATDQAQLAKKWIAEIAASEKQQSKWMTRAKKVEKIYNDERDVSSDRSRKFNILWSNVETLRPAVYMNTPKARAVRRYRDKDPVARLASMLLERCLQTSCELYDFDVQMDQAVRDRLVPGRGQVWIFYVPEFVGQGDKAMLAYESVVSEYVAWQDFLHSVCRSWSENRWVGRAFYKTRAELKKWLTELQLDPSAADTATMDVSTTGEKTDDGLKDERSKCKVWEVWDKDGGQVVYVAPGSSEDAILGTRPPPVKFRDFWPCPRPMLATTTSGSLIPTPDYALYQDQAEELNQISARISVLQKALKVAGVYASDSAELAQLIESGDNRMIAIKNWAMFAEGGGVKGRIEWYPVDIVAVVLKTLYEMREQAKQTLYEVSGIGDILRGESDPNETATAQGIKAKWGGQRVRRIQKDVQRFAADIMRLKAEVIAEQFKFQSITSMAGLDDDLLAKYMPPAPTPPQQQQPQPGQPPMDPAVAQMQAQAQQQAAQQMQRQAAMQFMSQVEKLLRDDTSRSFRIDVETDSTLEADKQEEKQIAVEFMTAMAAFLQQAAPLAAAGPGAAKMVGGLLNWAVRRFDKVDELEQLIEAATEEAAQPKPGPPPDPKVAADMEKAKGDQALKNKEIDSKEKIEAGKQALEDKRIEQVDKPKLRVEAILSAHELKAKQAEVAQRAQLEGKKLDQTDKHEGEKVAQADRHHQADVGEMQAARQAKTETERRALLGPEEIADSVASDNGQPTKAQALMQQMEDTQTRLEQTLQQIVAALSKPVNVVRGADGRVAGLQ